MSRVPECSFRKLGPREAVPAIFGLSGALFWIQWSYSRGNLLHRMRSGYILHSGDQGYHLRVYPTQDAIV